MKHVIGIDPSLTGTAVVGWVLGEDKPQMVRRLTSKPASTLAGRFRRYGELVRDVLGCMVEVPEVICIEGYSMNSKFAHVAIYEYGAALRSSLLLSCQGCRIAEVPPANLKQFATGKGNAGKELVAACVAKRWGEIFPTNDETDAYVLARMALVLAGGAECDNEAQRKAIAKVAA